MLEVLFRDSLMCIALVSGVPLGACAAAGLVVSVLQAATQVQEQSVGFTVKFTVVSLVLFLCGGWFCAEILNLTLECLGGIQRAGM